MTYILDTHVVVWLRLSPERLSTPQLAAIQSPDFKKCVSSISIWEISLKFSLGKLDLNGLTPEVFFGGLQELGIEIVSPTHNDLASFYKLDKLMSHKDPFNRMVIWQAIQADMTLISSDREFTKYAPHGLRLI